MIRETSAKYVNQTGKFYFRPKLKTAISLPIFNLFSIISYFIWIMPRTRVLFYSLNCAIFVHLNEQNIEEKQNSPNNLVSDGIRQITFHTFCKYVFFSLGYSLVRFIVLFTFNGKSNNAFGVLKLTGEPSNRLCCRAHKIKI